MLHRRRVQPPHRWLAGRVEHEDTEMVLDALEMARRSTWQPSTGRSGHTFRRRRRSSRRVRFTERLDEIGARPSIGTVADSYDNALAETTNGLYKTECVYGPDTTGWDDVDELELATLAGCTGSTSTGSTATATTSHPQNSSSVLRFRQRPVDCTPQEVACPLGAVPSGSR